MKIFQPTSKLLQFLQHESGVSSRSSWFQFPDLQVYLRNVGRTIDGKFLRTLDIANALASNPGNGAFTGFLEFVETTNNIYIESVLEPRLILFLENRGYSQVNKEYHTTNFFKPKRNELA